MKRLWFLFVYLAVFLGPNFVFMSSVHRSNLREIVGLIGTMLLFAGLSVLSWIVSRQSEEIDRLKRALGGQQRH